MIEAIIRNYLLSVVSVPVYICVPSNPPESFVSVELMGGSIENHIRSAMITVQSYGATKLEATKLHEKVLKKLPHVADGNNMVSSCDLNAEYSYTDTDTKHFRYQAVFDIAYY